MGFGSPDKGFGILIVYSDVRFDGHDQFWNAAKDTALEAVGRDAAEEALDHVEPRSGCRCEMDMKAGVFLQLFFDLEMLVRRVVVADQMQVLGLGRFAVDLAQEIEPFDVAVTLRTARDYGAIQGAHVC